LAQIEFQDVARLPKSEATKELKKFLKEKKVKLKDLNRYNLNPFLILLLIRARKIATLKRIFNNEMEQRGIHNIFCEYNPRKDLWYATEPEIEYVSDTYIYVISYNKSSSKYRKWVTQHFVFCRSEDGFWSLHRIPETGEIYHSIKSDRDVRKYLLGYHDDAIGREILCPESNKKYRIQGDLVAEALLLSDLDAFFHRYLSFSWISHDFGWELAKKLVEILRKRNVKKPGLIYRIYRAETGNKSRKTNEKMLDDIFYEYKFRIANMIDEKTVTPLFMRFKVDNIVRESRKYLADIEIQIGRHVVFVENAIPEDDLRALTRGDEPMDTFLIRAHSSFSFFVPDTTRMIVRHSGGEHSTRQYTLLPGTYEISILERFRYYKETERFP